MAGYDRKDMFKFVEQSWNVHQDVQDNDFSSLVERILESNQGCFLQGRAGTGKSHLISELQAKLKEQDKTYYTLAPTNTAAVNIGGETIHKFLVRLKNHIAEKKIDYLFVDEISMVQEIFYSWFILIKRKLSNQLLTLFVHIALPDIYLV